MVSQGTADTEMNVDELMARKLVEMRGQFEPFAVDNSAIQTMGDTMLMSIAVSLKRIADNGMVTQSYHAQTLTAVNALCMILDKIGNTMKPHSDTITSAIRSVEYELRNGNGKEIRINISKDD